MLLENSSEVSEEDALRSRCEGVVSAHEAAE